MKKYQGIKLDIGKNVITALKALVLCIKFKPVIAIRVKGVSQIFVRVVHVLLVLHTVPHALLLILF